MVRTHIFYTILVFLFLIASLFLNGLIIGPLSIRIYVSFLVFLFFIFRRGKFTTNQEMLLYVLFIGFYFLALIVNGELGEVDFAKRLLGSYLICFISFYILYKSMINQKDIKRIIFFLVCLGIINGIVSTLQFQGNSAAYLWASILTPSDLLEERIESYQRAESGLGIGVLGLFGTIVKNGYLSSSLAVLSLYMIVVAKNLFHRTTFVVISLFLLVSVFLTQQRLVTLLTLIVYLYFFYKFFKLRYFIALLILPTIVLFLWYFNNGIIESDNIGRLSNLEDEHRESIYARSLQFIVDNIFFGGQLRAASYLESAGLANSAHNFVLNAFIFSGVFGAMFVMILFARMMFKSFKSIFGKASHNNPSFFISTSLVVYLLNSLMHNSSLVSGDGFIWILFALLVKSQIVERYSLYGK